MFTVPYFTNVEVDLNWSDNLLCVNIPYRSDSPFIACNTIFAVVQTFGHSNICLSICTVEYQTIIFIFLIAFNLLLLLYSQLFGTIYRL